MDLKPSQEIIGKLRTISITDTSIKITFICTKEIEIPTSQIIYKKLQSLIGKNIGILNVDDRFFVREI